MSNGLAYVLSAALVTGGIVALVLTDRTGAYSAYIATFLGLLGVLITNFVQLSNQKKLHEEVKEIKSVVNNDD